MTYAVFGAVVLAVFGIFHAAAWYNRRVYGDTVDTNNALQRSAHPETEGQDWFV